ncbi:MAG: LytR/AlgR family response regulator transcription factor [Saprospiraceae bacterium]
MNILIIEDEILAKNKLDLYIHAAFANTSIIHWVRTIKDAIDFLEREVTYDLVFSDIKLLDGNAFEIFTKVKIECPIIFCTAYDEYLLDAFQTNGIAYLLKPYNEEHFKQAISKYELLRAKDTSGTLSNLAVQNLYHLVEKQIKNYKSRFSIKKKNGIKLLKIEDIASIEAQGSFSLAYDQKDNKHIINIPISEIESSLNPSLFFRINRSEIVSIDYIETIENYFKNRLIVKFKNSERVAHTSSSRTADFRKWLDQ